MLVDGRSYRSLWLDRDGRTVRIIDQRWLPHELWVVGLNTLDEAIDAIAEGRVRGGPLTAAVAAYGIAFAMFENPSNLSLMRALRPIGPCHRGKCGSGLGVARDEPGSAFPAALAAA